MGPLLHQASSDFFADASIGASDYAVLVVHLGDGRAWGYDEQLGDEMSLTQCGGDYDERLRDQLSCSFERI